jgi:hypothetical protein
LSALAVRVVLIFPVRVLLVLLILPLTAALLSTTLLTTLILLARVILVILSHSSLPSNHRSMFDHRDNDP